MAQAAAAQAVGKAVLENPEAFANAAKTAVEAAGMAAQEAGAIIEGARQFIKQSPAHHAYIVNLTDDSFTWHTYNEWAPIKWFT